MAVRMLEYDFYAAMREVAKDKSGQYFIDFPKSAVLYLRHNSKTPEEMSVKVRVSESISFDYNVSIIKTQLYSLKEILKKKLYLLLPFYLLRYEKETKQIEADENRLGEIVEEYRSLIFKLDESCENEEDSKRLQVYELERQMKRIVEYIFEHESNAKNEIGGTIMGGTVMKTIGEEIEELKTAIKEKEVAFSQAIKEKDDAIKEKDDAIKEKDDAIKEKEAALAKAMAEIERLKNSK